MKRGNLLDARLRLARSLALLPSFRAADRSTTEVIKSLTNFLFVCQVFVLRSALLKSVRDINMCAILHLAKGQSACLHVHAFPLAFPFLGEPCTWYLCPSSSSRGHHRAWHRQNWPSSIFSSSRSVLTHSNRPCPFLFFIFCLRIQDQLFNQPHLFSPHSV